jgi:hypothetical protein
MKAARLARRTGAGQALVEAATAQALYERLGWVREEGFYEVRPRPGLTPQALSF